MHVQVYTHKVDGNCNEVLKKLLKDSAICLPAKIEHFLGYDDESFIFYLRMRKIIKEMKEIFKSQSLSQSGEEPKESQKLGDILFEKINNSFPMLNATSSEKEEILNVTQFEKIGELINN